MKSCWYPAILAAAIALGFSAALAQPWPSKPIRAFIPGSATDIVPRALFEPLGVELGQSIIVENRGGAGGTLGMGAVVRADPDGYTILANSSAHTIAEWRAQLVAHVGHGAAVGRCRMDDDLQRAWALIDGDLFRATGRHHATAPFIERTRVMLSENWRAVEALAEEMVETRRIEGRRVQAIIDRARSR